MEKSKHTAWQLRNRLKEYQREDLDQGPPPEVPDKQPDRAAFLARLSPEERAHALAHLPPAQRESDIAALPEHLREETEAAILKRSALMPPELPDKDPARGKALAKLSPEERAHVLAASPKLQREADLAGMKQSHREDTLDETWKVTPSIK